MNQPTDYAFALTHGQPVPKPEPCPNVMMSDSTGENITLCGLACWVFCPFCELVACDDSCLRDQGCTHEPRDMDEAVAA